MINIGITGQSGFIGSHLFNTLGLYPDEFRRIPFEDRFFDKEDVLRSFVKQCDVIIHLAAVNRHPDPEVIYNTNIELTNRMTQAMCAEKVAPHVVYSSSVQESEDNLYGKSKQKCREILENWANDYQASFTGLIVPNVFGPFGRPNYNSFIATFCYKLTHNEKADIIQNNVVKLIYVGNLCNYIIEKIKEVSLHKKAKVEKIYVPYDFKNKVSDVLSTLETFKDLYFDKGYIPAINNADHLNLFHTFLSYIDYDTYFPRKLEKHKDERGVFVEILRLTTGGQISFSTTVPGVTRGNHYHTRKVERFTVLKGKARIEFRKIGTDKVHIFYLTGNEPAYVDMPIWYTHNITNVGDEDLYTQFWINECYNPEDGDTYFENV